MGAEVYAIAGADDKCKWLEGELGVVSACLKTRLAS